MTGCYQELVNRDDSLNSCTHGVRLDGECHYCRIENIINDPVNNPTHYVNTKAVCKCGLPIEPITITRHMSFNIGNAVKYLWRYLDKGGIEDLRKARWYLNDYISYFGDEKQKDIRDSGTANVNHNDKAY